MGRPAKPVSLHLAANNPGHKSKAELKRRAENEIQLGDKNMVMPGFLNGYPEAVEKWKELIELFKDVDFVSSSDTGFIARYCMTYAEYIDLLAWSERECGNLQIQQAVNKKLDMLIKYEDRMFLTPLSRVRNVPKKEPEREDPLAKKGFQNV